MSACASDGWGVALHFLEAGERRAGGRDEQGAVQRQSLEEALEGVPVISATTSARNSELRSGVDDEK